MLKENRVGTIEIDVPLVESAVVVQNEVKDKYVGLSFFNNNSECIGTPLFPKHINGINADADKKTERSQIICAGLFVDYVYFGCPLQDNQGSSTPPYSTISHCGCHVGHVGVESNCYC